MNNGNLGIILFHYHMFLHHSRIFQYFHLKYDFSKICMNHNLFRVLQNMFNLRKIYLKQKTKNNRKVDIQDYRLHYNNQ